MKIKATAIIPAGLTVNGTSSAIITATTPQPAKIVANGLVRERIISGNAALVFNEIPVGAVDGSNATFTSQYPFEPASVQVIVSGVPLTQVQDYYTVGTNTIQILQSPKVNENIFINYLKQ